MYKKSLHLVLTYILWLASAALSLWAMLWIRVLLLIDLPGNILHVNPWRLPAIDKFGLLILAALWIGFIVVSEARFRKLSASSHFPGYALRVFAIEALLLGVSYGIHLLI